MESVNNSIRDRIVEVNEGESSLPVVVSALDSVFRDCLAFGIDGNITVLISDTFRILKQQDELQQQRRQDYGGTNRQWRIRWGGGDQRDPDPPRAAKQKKI